jgi:hypothetical protein
VPVSYSRTDALTYSGLQLLALYKKEKKRGKKRGGGHLLHFGPQDFHAPLREVVCVFGLHRGKKGKFKKREKKEEFHS